MSSLHKRLRVDGQVSLAAIDTTATPGGPGDKDEAEDDQAALVEELGDLQERLWAQHAVEDSRRRVLLVLQGMDSAGKGGAVKGAFAGTDPRWVKVTGFGRPTPEELEHHFLWRIRKALPGPGTIGVFDRSHYEDVVTVRVRGIAEEAVWRPRFEEINAFERSLAEDGCTVVKVFLHISHGYQLERQLRRLERDDKRWKFDPGDIEDRRHWNAYQAAYEEAMERCPGWCVVPADTKWYRIWAVTKLLVEALRELDLEYPRRPELDVADLTRQLKES